MDVRKHLERIREFLRSLFWFLFPWLVLVAGAVVFIPLNTRMPGVSHQGASPPLTAVEQKLVKGVRRHVETLAGRIGERNMHHYDALLAADRYIEGELNSAGFEVTGEDYRVYRWPVRNLIATLQGADRPDEIIVVGAHYDSVWGSPGANDNATGVAAMLEIARLLSTAPSLERTIRFVAFVNEEPPYFKTEVMGSRVHASNARRRGERIVGMFSLETIGYYSDELNSQYFPFHLGLFYPWTGNFLGFVANRDSKELLFRSVAAFRRHTPFPSEGLSAPAWVTGVDWSDHWSFWEEGYPALMVTDTAPYRYPYYHDAEDTPDKVSFEHLARVTLGLAEVVKALANDDVPRS